MFSKILGRAAVAATAAGLALAVGTGTAQASTSSPYVGYGYTNNTHAVWCVQHLANDIADTLGHPKIGEDGVFGPATYNQVRWVQAELGPYVSGGLTVDGVVGPGTGYVLLTNGDDYYGNTGYCLGYVPTWTNDMPPIGHVVLD
ncbi:peptidoglycan-binding domain-containing protein [Streptomyces sp. NRRL F-5123]|uniref:peptidoglycan-binding domain-containing protein n=1 Tax=Streptomyces sp. NRRL F-5123 TaxID=1463856 RepID=UPI000694A028|nr:peptidoglycan-binding domain-containing protein [Streptomyces sp. NRRL F-5123]